jgi:hypothetical protein
VHFVKSIYGTYAQVVRLRIIRERFSVEEIFLIYLLPRIMKEKSQVLSDALPPGFEIG